MDLRTQQTGSRCMLGVRACRSAVWLLASGIIASCVSIIEADAARAVDGQSERAAAAALADKPSTDTSWSAGLKFGVNGPVPVIVVDQFGYPTKSSKTAIIRSPQAGYDKDAFAAAVHEVQVVDRRTGETVKRGLATPWHNGATDAVSGDRVWWFDFSDVEKPGTYAIVDTERDLRSPEFDIDDQVYRRVMKHAVRMFFYQRAGADKTARTAGTSWSDSASHLGPGQDPFTHSWLAKDDASQVKDLRGGWFDAGDYNKYTSWAARNIIYLLRAYEENPGVFTDNFGIPESGNGVPDILDEAKWGLDWIERMQNADGSLLCVQGLSEASPPSAAKGPSFYGPPTTAATVMGAAVFAYASKVFSARPEANLKAYAADLAQRAKSAWAWSTAHPQVLYYNNDDGKQPGSQGLASGQQEMDDGHRLAAQFEAAVYLYEITGDAEFAKFLEANFASVIPPWGPSQWDAAVQEALLYYAHLPAVSNDIKSTIVSKFVAGMTQNTDQLPMIVGKADPYRAPIKDYTWGSNLSKATQARLYELLASDYPDAAVKAVATSSALDFMHYIHGVNPLGLVYLTNMKDAGAENSAVTMYHAWFANGSSKWSRVSETNPGPAPGYLVGGPNPQYAINDFSPPANQPASKAYRQFNDSWPANSWEITEPSTGYQAAYILALSPFVH